jgi:hypothetical protein
LSSSFQYLNETKNTQDYIWDAFFQLFLFLMVVDTFEPKLGLITRWRVNHNYRQNYIKQESKQIFIDDDGIKIVSENLTEIVKWQDFDRVIENKKIFLLLHKTNTEYTIIPKKVFSQQTNLKNFQNILQTKKIILEKHYISKS